MMARSSAKGILVAVGVVAVAGIGYLTLSDRVGPNEGVEGAIGTAERHQMAKTQYYKEMTTENVETLARIAAKFENAPADAKKMLEKNGWSKEEFDKMVATVRSNDKLNKAFEAAKASAS